MKTILGIDCSSTTIGYAILTVDDVDIQFISCNYIKPPKKGNLIERIAQTRDMIQKIILDTKPDYIAIEEIISFMKGASTAKTVIMLTSFNRMVCLLAYDYLNRPPELYNVMSIRHGLKMNKVLPKKQDMPELVAKHLSIKFPYEYNKKGKIKVECEDQADAVAVALFHSFKLIGRLKKK